MMTSAAGKSNKENPSRAVGNQPSGKKKRSKETFHFVDNRPEAIQLRKSQEMADNSPQSNQLKALQEMANNSPRMVSQRQQLERMFGMPVQRQEALEEEELQLKPQAAGLEEEEELQMKAEAAPVQRQGLGEEEELQMKAEAASVHRQDGLEEEDLLQGKFEPVQKEENKTGLPDNLKSGIENLSGVSMDSVKVHYNSSKPTQLQALAYTQGTDIHVAPAQEKHLPHEAWHMVQQSQGRVKPTIQVEGVSINDDKSLEGEADVMGAKSLQMRRSNPVAIDSAGESVTADSAEPNIRSNHNQTTAIQRLIVNAGSSSLLEEAAKPSGWITLSTLDVGIKMDTGTDIVEMDNVGSVGEIGQDENIFIVGHGSTGKVAAANPSTLAGVLKGAIPNDWQGLIAALTCNAGLAESAGTETGGKQLHEKLGVPVVAAKGQTFTHPDIDMAVRVLDTTSYAGDFRRYYLKQLKLSKDQKQTMLKSAFPKWAKVFDGGDESQVNGWFNTYCRSIDTTIPEVSKILDTFNFTVLGGRTEQSRDIDQKHADLNTKWATYMKNPPGSIKDIAAEATKISSAFYKTVVEYGDRYKLLHAIDSDFEAYE